MVHRTVAARNHSLAAAAVQENISAHAA